MAKLAHKLGITEDWDLGQVGEKKASASALQLLSTDYRRSTLAIWGAFVAVMFSYYFVSSWTPALLKEAGMSLEQSVSVGMMISLGGTLGSLAFGALASRWSARNVLMAFGLGSAIIASIFIALAAHLWLAIIAGIWIGFLMNGCISGLYDIRSTGVGVAIGVGRLGAILAPTIAGALLDSGFDKQDLYMGVGLVMVLAVISVAFLRKQEGQV